MTAPVDTGAPLLVVREVHKAFGDHRVLRGVSLELSAGEILGLTGENGVGKTTLASIVAGLETASGGSMELGGRPHRPGSEQDGRRAGVGIVRQNLELDPESSVADVVLPLDPAGPERDAAVRRLLISVGLALPVEARMRELVRAERGLVELVRLLADESLSVVILDEVSATFNAREAEDLHYIATRLAQQGRGVLMISHRLRELDDLCERVLVLRGGRVTYVHGDEDAPAAGGADAPRSSVEELAAQVYGEPVELPGPSPSHAREAVALRLADLRAGRLDGLSLEVHVGEVVGLVGGRDSGIADLVAALTGDRPGAARVVEVGGRPRSLASPQDAVAAGIAYLAEDDADPTGVDADVATARSLLVEGLGEGADFDSEVAGLASILEQLRSFGDRFEQLLHRPLSTGQRRLLIASEVLTLAADLFVLAEPARNLDRAAVAKLDAAIAAATERGSGVLLLCSDHELLLRWSDRVVVLEEGSIRAIHAADAVSAQTLDDIVREGYFSGAGAAPRG